MAIGKADYRERVPAPRTLRIGVSALTAALLCVMLAPGLGMEASGLPDGLALLLFFLGFVAIGYAVSTLSYGVRIKLSSGSMLGLDDAPVLSVLGTSHNGRIYIPVSDITAINAVFYDESTWRTLLRPFATLEKGVGHVVNLPGYRGTGLAITYSHAPLWGGGARESTVRFPTTRPQLLHSLLSEI